MTESQAIVEPVTVVNTNKEEEKCPEEDVCVDGECLADGSPSNQEDDGDSPEETIEDSVAEAVSSSPLPSSIVSLGATEEQKEGSADASVQESSSSTTESATAATDNNSNEKEEPSVSESAAAKWNKARVAVTGGLVTAVRLVMIPAPLPVGAIITAYGVSILAQEFDGAQVALENGKKALEGGFEKLADSLHKDEGEEEVAEVEGGDNKTAETTTKTSEDQPKDGEEQELPSEEATCSSPVTEEKKIAELTKEEETTKETSDAEIAPPTKDQELEDILLDETQSFREGAGKVWNLHTRNMRKVTSRFITNKLLPALRDVNIEAPPADESKSVSIGVTNNTSAFPSATAYVESSKVLDNVASDTDTASMTVPMSTTSIASSSESSSSDESTNEPDNDLVEVVFPTQIAATSL